MAGVLPGVEAARRRRFHRSSGKDDGGATVSKRFSFCLYATNNQEFHFSSISSLERDPIRREVCSDEDDDETLDAAVREAKQRLDHRFQQTSCRSQITRKVEGREAEGKLKLKSQGKNLYRLILKRGYQSS